MSSARGLWAAILVVMTSCIAFARGSVVTLGTYSNSQVYPDPSGMGFTHEMEFSFAMAAGEHQADVPLFPSQPFWGSWWTPADVDTTRWINAGSDFQYSKALLTNGTRDTLGWGFDFRLANGSIAYSQGILYWVNERDTAGDVGQNNIDLAGFQVNALGLNLRQLILNDTTYFGSPAIGAAWNVALMADITPVPEPLYPMWVPALLLFLIERRRRSELGRSLSAEYPYTRS